MEEFEKRFFNTFNIPPITKKGETYFCSNVRFCEMIADEDRYPIIDMLKLEEVLLDLQVDCEVHIRKNEIYEEDKPTGKRYYSYLYIENDYKEPENYHHGFVPMSKRKFYTTRKEALLELLIHYSYYEDIRKGVRKVFGVEDEEDKN